MERGNQTEQHAGGDRHAEREREHAAVDAGGGEPDDVGRNEGDQRPRAPGRQHQPARTGDQRQQQAFGNQLPDDAAAAGAERRANRHLPRAADGFAQQQRGGVGAGNQQHHTDDAPQEIQRETHIANQLVLQTRRGDATAFVALGILLLERGRNDGQIGLRLFERDIRLEAPDGEEVVPGAAGRARRLGSQTSVSPGNWKPGGITPTIDLRRIADANGSLEDSRIAVRAGFASTNG